MHPLLTYRRHIGSEVCGLGEGIQSFKIKKVSKMWNLGSVVEVFNNQRKAGSVVEGARMISKEGFINFKRRVLKEGSFGLAELPSIRPITKDHLAGNIGLADVPKCDVWVRRVARLFGLPVIELIEDLSNKFKEKRRVADLILWRFCADHFRGEASLVNYVRTHFR